MTQDSKLIALDADGVLVNYHAGYAQAWERAFGETVSVADPDAYYAMNRFGVRRLGKEDRDRLRDAMDTSIWSALAPLDGALEACQALSAAGFRLVCVSAIREEHREAREQNLRDIGFPLEAVHAAPKTGTDVRSPKAEALETLNPIAFVDDYAPYLRGVSDDIHKALILREPNGSPNTGNDLKLADSTHTNLLVFSEWWLAGAGQSDA